MDSRMLTFGLGLASITAIASLVLLRPHEVIPAAKVVPAASPPTAMQRSAIPTPQGFPNVSNTGVPTGTALKTVPSQVSSGPGWYYDSRGWVQVDGNGAQLTGLYIPYSVDIEANNVTLNHDDIVNKGYFGISLRRTSGVTIENSTISGQNASTGEVDSAIDDLYGNSTGLTIKDDNISLFETAVQASSGLITGNYIHNAGYKPGDHTNGILDNGSTKPLMISHNTILIDRPQTDAIILDSNMTGKPVANKTIVGNLLGGGSYAIYGGATLGNTTSHIVIKNNTFSKIYYSNGGHYGPVAYFSALGQGNTWTGNIWLSSSPSNGSQAGTIPTP
jgi:hypothetical protein